MNYTPSEYIKAGMLFSTMFLYVLFMRTQDYTFLFGQEGEVYYRFMMVTFGVFLLMNVPIRWGKKQ